MARQHAEIGDALVRWAEHRGPKALLVRRRPEDEIVCDLVGDAQREAGADVRGDPGRQPVFVRSLGGEQQNHAERAAELDDSFGEVAGLRAVLLVPEQLLHLIDGDDQRVQAASARQLGRHPVLGTQIPGQSLDPFGLAPAFVEQIPEGLQDLLDDVIVGTGRVPARHLAERLQVTAALQFVDP